jgi:hypothetical protein
MDGEIIREQRMLVGIKQYQVVPCKKNTNCNWNTQRAEKLKTTIEKHNINKA